MHRPHRESAVRHRIYSPPAPAAPFEAFPGRGRTKGDAVAPSPPLPDELASAPPRRRAPSPRRLRAPPPDEPASAPTSDAACCLCAPPRRLDAPILFDGMPAQNRGKEDEGAAVETGEEDRLGALPDALLHQEAVRTCVLAQRWRHLWKSAPGLRIGCLRNDEPVSVATLQRFVNCLFSLRGASPLHTCKLRIGDFSKEGDEDRVNLWFRHAVASKVREFKLHVEDNDYMDPWLSLDDRALVSHHLTRLKLYAVRCHDNFLDFASCSALEHLELEYCHISSATKISSESIKSLSITNSPFSNDSRLRIYAPNLLSLHLDEFWSMAPILENMPSLVEAFVRVTDDCSDCCNKLYHTGKACNCEYCDSGNIGNGSSVLLKGLSKARKLVLISKPEMFIFKRDLRWCPTFSMLKTLVLDGYWCARDDFSALACMLEHSPVLEKLTLQLFSEEPDYIFEMKGTFSSMKRSSAISEHLKIVEIKSEDFDKRVFKVLKFPCTFNITFSC
ncbi:hypothetical protein EJB05_36406, partial [Eragrostis curvula]